MIRCGDHDLGSSALPGDGAEGASCRGPIGWRVCSCCRASPAEAADLVSDVLRLHFSLPPPRQRLRSPGPGRTPPTQSEAGDGTGF